MGTHCRARRTQEVKVVQGARTDFFHSGAATRFFSVSLASTLSSPVTCPERVRAGVLTSTGSMSKRALCPLCIRGSSSSTPRSPCPRRHARVCEDAPAWQPQLQATRRASEAVAWLPPPQGTRPASEWEPKDAKTEALLVPRHGVTLPPARSARLPSPRRRQSPQPVLAPPRDASGVSARQLKGMGARTKTFWN